jgi:hypothetical protein
MGLRQSCRRPFYISAFAQGIIMPYHETEMFVIPAQYIPQQQPEFIPQDCLNVFAQHFKDMCGRPSHIEQSESPDYHEERITFYAETYKRAFCKIVLSYLSCGAPCEDYEESGHVFQLAIEVTTSDNSMFELSSFSTYDEALQDFAANISHLKKRIKYQMQIEREKYGSYPGTLAQLSENEMANIDTAGCYVYEGSNVTTLIRYVRNVLRSAPRMKKYEKLAENQHFTFGHCYQASEFLYHMLGGNDSLLQVYEGKNDAGISHWWLATEDGDIIDPTLEQYLWNDKLPPYSSGRPSSFHTKRMSKRTRNIFQSLLP